MCRFALAVLLVATACGGGGSVAMTPDAPPADAPPIDSPPSFAACGKFAAPGVPVPAHVAGQVAGADLTAPAMCATIQAPFGVESAGPDSVVHLTGLVPGTPYIVHLESDADLGFYVATGCDTATGPSSAACLLFEDDSSGHSEIGHFVAPGTEAFVIVDFYQSTPPHDGSFTVDVYREECGSLAGTCPSATPACLLGQCVACVTSFDCPDADQPVCDTNVHACVAGDNLCTSDDAGEPDDDGPAGAPAILLDETGHGAVSGQMCASPAGESDFIAFTVDAIGETWDFQLFWSGSRDLDLELFDSTGEPIGLSFWDQPERARLTYLAVGTYYARVSEFSTTDDPTAVTYTLSATRALGSGCMRAADCASEFRNQIYRGACTAGACVAIAGNGGVAKGGACDSESDCAAGLACPSFFFVADADTRELCEPTCAHDSDCAALGSAFVCTTFLAVNQCVEKCTDDSQCPTAIDSMPSEGPWSRLACDVTSGRCLP